MEHDGFGVISLRSVLFFKLFLLCKAYRTNTRNYFRLHLFAVLFLKDHFSVFGIHVKLEEIFQEC